MLALLGGRCAHPPTLYYRRVRAKRGSVRGGHGLIMNWPDLSMGGYGFYVWGSYLFAMVAIIWEVLSLSHRKRALRREKTTASPSASVLRGSTNETTP